MLPTARPLRVRSAGHCSLHSSPGARASASLARGRSAAARFRLLLRAPHAGSAGAGRSCQFGSRRPSRPRVAKGAGPGRLLVVASGKEGEEEEFFFFDREAVYDDDTARRPASGDSFVGERRRKPKAQAAPSPAKKKNRKGKGKRKKGLSDAEYELLADLEYELGEEFVSEILPENKGRTRAERKQRRDSAEKDKAAPSGAGRASSQLSAQESKSLEVGKGVPCCYGCGAVLQCDNDAVAGYLEPEKYESKKAFKQLWTVLCMRCQSLCNGEMLPAVAEERVGGGGALNVGDTAQDTAAGSSSSRVYMTAAELREMLKIHIMPKRAMVVMVVDILDFSGSFLRRVRDLVGSNPIVLVASKMDLLPKKSYDVDLLHEWIEREVVASGLRLHSVHLTSAKQNEGINDVAHELMRSRTGRNVYIIGAANVGKTAFIRALTERLANINWSSPSRHRPIESPMPGTTLGVIPLRAFYDGAALYDTPGVHLVHRMVSVLGGVDLRDVVPRARVRPYTPKPVLPPDVEIEEGRPPPQSPLSLRKFGASFEGYSLFWGGLVRLDVLEAPPSLSLTFYGPKGLDATSLKVHVVPSTEADAFYRDHVGRDLLPPSSGSAPVPFRSDEPNVPEACVLKPSTMVKLFIGRNGEEDIAISGLGWVALNFMSGCGSGGEVSIRVSVPRGVGVFVRRDPIPIGKEQGKGWARPTHGKEQPSREEWQKARPDYRYRSRSDNVDDYGDDSSRRESRRSRSSSGNWREDYYDVSSDRGREDDLGSYGSGYGRNLNDNW